MKVLILGAGGMLGHKLYQTLSKQHKCKAVFRKNKENYNSFHFFHSDQMIGNIDVNNTEKLIELLNRERPQIVCNAIGKTTRKIKPQHSDSVVYLNSYLPHLLNRWCLENQSYLVQFSTDCVFSGKNGPYATNDLTDARDLYGLSKILGEVHSPAALTLRTSIIGREIENKTEFMEWVFSKKNSTAQGYKNVFYSGVTTLYLSEIVATLLERPKKLTGVFQIASPTISKLDLIKKINSVFNLNIKVIPNFEKVSNKALKATDFHLTTKINPPSWDQMLTQLKQENELYENINGKGVKTA